jgi:PBP1b-binding outer membrane lipoprotein LpoB
MKRLIFIACTALFAVSCNNTTTSDGKKKGNDSTTIEASTEKPDYPYSLEKPHQEWQFGDPKNSLMALKMLKA